MSAKLDRLMQQAVAAHQRGDLASAAAAYRKVLATFPGQPDAMHLLGLTDYQRGDHARAIAGVRAAIRGNPGQPLFRFNLGRILFDAGEREAAVTAYREALQLAPDYAEAAGNLANALVALGRRGEAIVVLDALLARRPGDAGSWARLGTLLGDSARFADAARCFARAVELAGETPDLLYRHANMLLRRGDAAQAQQLLERLLALTPDSGGAHNGLAVALLARQQLQAAESELMHALRLQPDLAEAWFNLGQVRASRGDPAPAVLDCYRRAGRSAAVLQVLEALLVPPILDDVEAIDGLRRQLAERLDALLADPAIVVADPLAEIGRNGLFYLAYHGRNDRALYQRATAMLLRACPALGEVAPHCRRPPAGDGVAARPPEGESAAWRPRIGFVSAYFCEHTIGRLFKDLIGRIDRQRCEVFVLFAPGLRDGLGAQLAQSCEHAIELPADLAQARTLIAGLELDALFYPDIGMSGYTWLLGFARLAPLQCTAWGHPATTGLPAIDVFVSSRHQEREDAQDDYSEELVRLEHPLYVYSRPGLPVPPAQRAALHASVCAEFGIADSRRLYVCPQSLFKIQPPFDPLLAAILRRDPAGIVLLPESSFPEWNETLRRRFHRSCPDVAERIVFTPRIAHERYLRLLDAADVMLDSLPFGGGMTTLDALAAGTPIVTLPGPLMPSRFTSTCYERMGWRECIAGSADDYVERALRIAGSPSLRAGMQAAILERHGVLYDNHAVVRELEDFLVDRCRLGARRAGGIG